MAQYYSPCCTFLAASAKMPEIPGTGDPGRESLAANSSTAPVPATTTPTFPGPRA